MLRSLRRKVIPMWQDTWPDIVSRFQNQSVVQMGCGMNKLDHVITVDVIPATNPDVLWDLNKIPYPFHDNAFDAIVALSVLEHLDNFFAVMGEFHRIAKNNASIYILVPHFSSAASFIDPSHRIHFSARSCDYFIPGSDIEGNYGFYESYRYRMVQRYIELQGILNYLPPLRWFVQHFPAFWEEYLCFLIRGEAVFWELKVMKSATAEPKNRPLS